MEHKSYTEKDLKKSLIVAGILTGAELFMKIIVPIFIRLEGAKAWGRLIIYLGWLDWFLPVFLILSWSEYVKRYVYLKTWSEDGDENGKSRWRIYAGIGIKILIGIVLFFAVWFVTLFAAGWLTQL